MAERIGVFGGTFDPPHRGHLQLAKVALAQLDLKFILWVLTPDPPHKQGQLISPVQDRLAMLRLALAKSPEYILSEVDLDRPGPQYALDTVRRLMGEYPGKELVYLIGGDSLQDLPGWHLPGQLVATVAELGVMRRPGAVYDLQTLEQVIPGITAKIRFVDTPAVDISGTEIRQRAATGKSFRKFVTPAVYQYIQAHSLYTAPRPLVTDK